MAIKMDMTSVDLDKQIGLLKHFPQIMEKHFRHVLQKDVKLLADRIRPSIPVRSGKAVSKFKNRVTGKGVKLQGQVGWFGKGKNEPWYVNVLEHGAKPHKMGYVPALGVSFTKRPHPGISKRGFMAAGFSAIRPIIFADMAKASENVVRDLEVK
jgi:hypothetical protein